MHKRIRELRENLKLSQTAFAEKLGMTRSMISNMELGLVEVPGYRISVIIKEFNVSEHWLRTGEGEMFLPKPESSLPAELTDDPMIRAILEAYLDLDPQGRETFRNFFADVVARYKAETAPEPRTRKIPLIQGTDESEIQIAYQSKQEQRELDQLNPTPVNPT